MLDAISGATDGGHVRLSSRSASATDSVRVLTVDEHSITLLNSTWIVTLVSKRRSKKPDRARPKGAYLSEQPWCQQVGRYWGAGTTCAFREGRQFYMCVRRPLDHNHDRKELGSGRKQ